MEQSHTTFGQGCRAAVFGAVVGALGNSLIVYFTSGLNKIGERTEGIEEGIFMLTVPPLGALLGSASALTIRLWYSKAWKEGGLWGFVVGGFVTACIGMFGLNSLRDAGWTQQFIHNYLLGLIWAVLLAISGVATILYGALHPEADLTNKC